MRGEKGSWEVHEFRCFVPNINQDKSPGVGKDRGTYCVGKKRAVVKVVIYFNLAEWLLVLISQAHRLLPHCPGSDKSAVRCRQHGKTAKICTQEPLLYLLYIFVLIN